MTGREIVKHLLIRTHTNTSQLAKRSGNSPQNTWGRLNANDTKDLTLIKMDEYCRAMGYKVIVVPENTRLMTEWYEYTPGYSGYGEGRTEK